MNDVFLGFVNISQIQLTVTTHSYQLVPEWKDQGDVSVLQLNDENSPSSRNTMSFLCCTGIFWGANGGHLGPESEPKYCLVAQGSLRALLKLHFGMRGSKDTLMLLEIGCNAANHRTDGWLGPKDRQSKFQ